MSSVLQLLAQEIVLILECLDLIVAFTLQQFQVVHVLRLFVRQFLLEDIDLGLEVVSLLLMLVLISRQSIGSVLQVLSLLGQQFVLSILLLYLVFHFDVLRK